jgi:zinc transporter ZupT
MNPTKKMLIASIAYAILLVGSMATIKFGGITGLPAVLLALLPLAAGVYVVLAVRDFIVAADELQRKIQLEALAMAMAGTFLLLLAGSLLPIAEIDEPSYAWPLAAMSVMWALGQVVASLRYR